MVLWVQPRRSSRSFLRFSTPCSVEAVVATSPTPRMVRQLSSGVHIHGDLFEALYVFTEHPGDPGNCIDMTRRRHGHAACADEADLAQFRLQRVDIVRKRVDRWVHKEDRIIVVRSHARRILYEHARSESHRPIWESLHGHNINPGLNLHKPSHGARAGLLLTVGGHCVGALLLRHKRRS
jgi:hypothetical protein